MLGRVTASGFNNYNYYDAPDLSTFMGGSAAGSLYVRKYFKPEDKNILLELVGYIRSSFENILNEVPWMDDVTKKEAKTKLDMMNQYIAYPDELLDMEVIDEIHEGKIWVMLKPSRTDQCHLMFCLDSDI